MIVRTVERVMINGPLYSEIKKQQELLADILPPPFYVIESYLTIIQLASQSHALDRGMLEQKLRSLRAEYETRQAFWQAQLPEGQMSDLLVKRSNEPARRLFAIAFEQLLPLIDAGEYEQADRLVNSKILAAYNQHREAIDELVALTKAKSDQVEKTVRLELSSSYLPMLIVVGLLLVATVLAAFGLTFEISRRKLITLTQQMKSELQAEREISRINQEKVRAIFDQSHQFIGLLDTQGTLLEVNQTALKFAGISAEQVIGKPFWETPWWTHSAPLMLRLQLAIRQALEGEFVRFETEHAAADGTQHTIDFSLKPVHDANGRVIYLIPEGHDITERKQAEKMILQAKEAAEAALHENNSQKRTIQERPIGSVC